MSLLLESLRLSPLSFKIAGAVITVQGPDSKAYLDSQTTNSINSLGDRHFQFNSVLDLSGKIIGSFVLAQLSDNHFEVYIQKENLKAVSDRLEKYHISEDLEIGIELRDTYLSINSIGEGILGKFFFEGDMVSAAPLSSLGSKDDFQKLKVLTGVPTLGQEVKTGELINNSFFDELSVDYTKGCFPGQETVSKINTRRGASYKPVLGISKEKYSGDLKVENKKIGTVHNSFENDGHHYHYLSLLRNYRIDKSEIGDLKIHYYPFIATTKLELARELYDCAVDLFQHDQDEKAKKYFERAIELDPKFEDAYESLGVLYGRLENYRKAIELMEKLKNLNPKSMMAYTNLSLYHMKLGHIETAEDFKSQATLLNFELLGDEAERKRQKEELEKQKLADRDRREGMFQQVLEMDPEDAMANNGMGEILLEKGSPEKAIPHFEQAIAADKKYSVAYLGLAKCFVQLNQLDSLRDALDLGIEIAGKNGDLMPANEMQSLKSQYL